MGKDIHAPRVSMWRYFVEAITVKYADFSGHASGREYASFVVYYWIMYVVSLFISWLFYKILSTYPTADIFLDFIRKMYRVVLFIPFAAVTARRLHDAGFSAWLLPLNHIVLWWWLFCLITWGKYSIDDDEIMSGYAIFWFLLVLIADYGSYILDPLVSPIEIFLLFSDLFPLISLFILSKLPSDPNSRYLKCPPLERWEKNVIIVGGVIYLGLAIFTSELFQKVANFVENKHKLYKETYT